MRVPSRIHIFGASGSGTTSLAAAIARKHGHRHLDTDDFFWAPTNPPYREKRPRDQRLVLLRQALLGSVPWVLSGSLCGWGDPLIPEFDLVVLLAVPTPVRLARLRAREAERYRVTRRSPQKGNSTWRTLSSSSGRAAMTPVVWRCEVEPFTRHGWPPSPARS